MPSSAMLMAAGLGTRLRPFTDLEPKALLPVMGIPCARFALEALGRAGVKRLVANVHHHADRAREGLRALAPEIQISDESACLLGSAGGVATALPLLGGGPFFLVNADVICDVDFAALARKHAELRASHGVRLTLAVFPGPTGGGSYREILLDESRGVIRGLGALERGRPFFIGVAVMEPEALHGLKPGEPAEFVPKILEPAIAEGKAGYFLSSGCWLDIGSPELWAEAHFELMERLEKGTISPVWRRTLEAASRRVGEKMWVSKGVSRNIAVADWQGPLYFGNLEDSTARPPRALGPNALHYGNLPPAKSATEARFENEIAYRGLFKKLIR